MITLDPFLQKYGVFDEVKDLVISPQPHGKMS